MQIGIVGAGIMGRLLAFTLVNAGHQVSLFEKNNAATKNCSFAAAGMLASVSELAKADPIIYDLGSQSIDLWPDIISQLNKEIYFKKNGSLVVSHPQDRGELKRFIEIIAGVMPAKAGIQSRSAKSLDASFRWHDSLDKEKITQLEPELTKFPEAYYFEQEAHLDSQTIMLELANYLHQNGVKWFDNTPVDNIFIQKMQSDFDLVIDCRGLGAKDTFQELQGIRGEIIWLQAPDVNITRPIRLLHPRYSLYVVPRPNHIYLVGASEIHSEDNSEISVRSALELLTAVFYLHAGFAEARILKTVTAARPTLPHYLPRIKYANDFIAINGLYRHGFLIAPTLTQEVLRFIEGGKTTLHYPQIGEFND